MFMRPPDLASPAFKAYPYQFYKRLRHEAPVLPGLKFLGHDVTLVARYADVLALFKDQRFSKHPIVFKGLMKLLPSSLNPPPNMLDSDPPDHTRFRTLVHQGFTPRRIEALRERVTSLCHELLDHALAQGSFDLVKEYALPVPMTIISEMIGVPIADRDRFHRMSSSAINISNLRNLPTALPSMIRLNKYMQKLVAQRRADPQDDLLTDLINARDDNDTLTDQELVGMLLLLLIAGHETTVNLLGSGTLALLQNPEQLQLLREQSEERMPSAVEELLRFCSPVEVATERYAIEDLDIDGQSIKRGTLVFGVIGSANRDETVFEHPDQLDLARSPNRHLGFGQGIHYCLGAPLARLEAQLAFHILLERAPNLRLAEAPDKLKWRRNMLLRGLKTLPVQV